MVCGQAIPKGVRAIYSSSTKSVRHIACPELGSAARIGDSSGWTPKSSAIRSVTPGSRFLATRTTSSRNSVGVRLGHSNIPPGHPPGQARPDATHRCSRPFRGDATDVVRINDERSPPLRMAASPAFTDGALSSSWGLVRLFVDRTAIQGACCQRAATGRRRRRSNRERSCPGGARSHLPANDDAW